MNIIVVIEKKRKKGNACRDKIPEDIFLNRSQQDVIYLGLSRASVNFSNSKGFLKNHIFPK